MTIGNDKYCDVAIVEAGIVGLAVGLQLIRKYPSIGVIFSVVETCRRLDMPIRNYLANTLPDLRNLSIQTLVELTAATYATHPAK